ncbi:MAG: PAS domain S-box protein [Anaerolineae bacterium]|nr:PAS domain S-box protein [Anaerolineae bacterium]
MTLSALGGVAVPLFVVHHNRILFATAAAHRLTGYPPEHLAQVPFTALYTDTTVGRLPAPAAPPASLPAIIGTLIRAGGELCPVEISAALIHDDDGQPVSLFTVQDLRRFQPPPLEYLQAAPDVFQERLKALQQAVLELTATPTMHAFFQQVILQGQQALDFDRLGLWLVTDDQQLVGTCGTDEEGHLRDERHVHLPIDITHFANRPVYPGLPLYVSTSSPLINHRAEVVGHGWVLVACLVEQQQVIGYLSVDNYLRRQPLAAYEPELLSLYATAITSIYRRKRLEEALREANQRYDELVAGLPGMVYRVRRRGDDLRFEYVSPRSQALHDIDPAAAIDHPDWLLRQIHPDDRADYDRAAHHSRAMLEPFVWEGRFIIRGQVQWRRLESRPYTVADGSIIWDGIATDITALREATAALQTSESSARRFADRLKRLTSISLRLSTVATLDELWRQAVLVAHDLGLFDRLSIWLCIPSTRLLRGTFGIDEHGHLRDEREKIIPIDTDDEMYDYVEAIHLETGMIPVSVDHDAPLYNDQVEIIGHGWQMSAPLAEGDQMIGMMYVDNLLTQQPLTPYDASLVALYAATLSNLYRRKQAEASLRDSESRYRLLAEHTTDLVALQTMDGIITYASPSFERTLGYSVADMQALGRMEFFHPDDREYVRRFMHTPPAAGTVARMEYRACRKDGTWVWLETLAKPILDAEGHITHMLLSSRDITGRQMMQAALVEQETLRVALHKERELGELKTHMMERLSHEFRTPLAIINTSAELLERYATRLSLEQNQQRLLQIKKQVKHLTATLDDIVLLLRGEGSGELYVTQVNLPRLCQQVIDQAQREQPSPRAITLALENGLDGVAVDEKIVQYILAHLLDNALKYSGPAAPVSLHAWREAGTLYLSVQDAGPGIALAEQRRIFEPLYRSPAQDESPGLGLGLSIVKAAVQTHQGTIELHSTPGHGSRFIVRLPLLPRLLVNMGAEGQP